MLKRGHCWGWGSREGKGLQGQGGARPGWWYQGLGGPVATVRLGAWQAWQVEECLWNFWQRGQSRRRVGGAGGSGGGKGGGLGEARRLPQSEGSPSAVSRLLEVLAGDSRHGGEGGGMQDSQRHLDASLRAGGPGEGQQDRPKDWWTMATEATARATLLT